MTKAKRQSKFNSEEGILARCMIDSLRHKESVLIQLSDDLISQLIGVFQTKIYKALKTPTRTSEISTVLAITRRVEARIFSA